MDAKPENGKPKLVTINLLTTRKTRLISGECQVVVWCDTANGRLQLVAELPQDGTVEHIKIRKDGEA